MLARDARLAAMDSGATASAAPRDRRGRARSDCPWTWIHRRTVTWRRPALAKGGRAVEATAPSAILRWDAPCRLPRTLATGARRASPCGWPGGMASRVEGGARCLTQEVGPGRRARSAQCSALTATVGSDAAL